LRFGRQGTIAPRHASQGGDCTYAGNGRQKKIAVAENDTSLPGLVASSGEVSVNRYQLFRKSAKENAMLDIKSLLLMLLSSSWGVITVVLIGALVYRGTLSSREADQIFLDDAEQHYYQEQQAIIARMSRLRGPIIALSLASGILFLTTVGVWIYQGYSSF
jgi:hypothetical protein